MGMKGLRSAIEEKNARDTHDITAADADADASVRDVTVSVERTQTRTG